MADPWELILHHTYRGAPGLVYDSSPRQGSHGVAVGAVKFHTDGASPDTGVYLVSDPRELRARERGRRAGTSWPRFESRRAACPEFPDPDMFFQTIIRCSLFTWVTYRVHIDGEPVLWSMVILGSKNS